MDAIDACRLMSDEELIAGLDRLAAADKSLTKDLIAHLAVVDERPACKKRGFPSLYVYCTKRLKFSEATAFKRIQAARLARRYRIILELLEAGETNLSALLVIGPHLREDTAKDLFLRIRGKTRREVEMIAASLSPGPARRDIIARAAAPTGTADWPAAAPPGDQTLGRLSPSGASQPISFSFDKLEPVSGERLRLHFDVGSETAKLLERAREVMRHKFPLASFEDIVKEALKLLLEERDPEIKLKLEKENAKEVLTAGRQVPIWVRRKVWRRDGGRCAFLAEDGTRCGERSGLEYDHVIPYAKGGRSDEPGNIRLLCRAHNQLSGLLAFPPTSNVSREG